MTMPVAPVRPDRRLGTRAPGGPTAASPASFLVPAICRRCSHTAARRGGWIGATFCTTTTGIAPASAPALIGLPFHAPTIPGEFDLTGAIAACRAAVVRALQIGSRCISA